MALAWFIAPFEVVANDSGFQYRQCAMNDFNTQIAADGGIWSEVEILGNVGLVKVRAAASTLTAINAAAGFMRIPNHTNLNDTLGDLTANQRQAILNEALALGYTQAQINAALPANWATVTLRQVLAFLSSRWRRPTSITNGATIFENADWPGGTPSSIVVVDSVVQ